MLNELGTRLLEEAIRLEAPPPGVQDRVLSTLAAGFTSYTEPTGAQSLAQPTFNYRQIAEALEKVLADLEISRLFLILDEWAQIPMSAQPYVAEYLKRSILCVPQVSVKLLAVSYQCVLSVQDNTGMVGIQRGADVPDTLDLDSYLIYEENEELVTNFFAQVLYNHLGGELGWELSVPPGDKRKRVLDLFTQQPAFIELVRAGEGNCRDFLCIFSRAFFGGFRQRGGANAISIPHVREAASAWFDTGKYVNIRDEEQPRKTLEFIITNVIKGYKSRTFMVEAAKARSAVLTRLLNERVLHKLSGFYSHPDRPGERYELFTVDYGAYVRFKDTINEPYQTVLLPSERVASLEEKERMYMVPLDDKRSIRRIVFDPERFQLDA